MGPTHQGDSRDRFHCQDRYDRSGSPARRIDRPRIGRAHGGPHYPMEVLSHNFREGQGRPRDYAKPEDVDRLIEASPPEWRTLIALGRYGGLRCPSEALILRWETVDLPGRRMTVISPKTENQGKGWRTVPITPKLAAHLEVAWELAGRREHVVNLPQYRSREGNWIGCNIRTQLGRLMKRSGVPAWSRPFRVFRPSCVTDWASEHPIHAVAAWAGHTVAIAGKHYLTVTDADFVRATRSSQAQKAASQVAVMGGHEQRTGDVALATSLNGEKRCETKRKATTVQNDPYGIRTRDLLAENQTS
jgi:integrase